MFSYLLVTSTTNQSCPWVGLTRGLGWVGLRWVGLGSENVRISWVGLGREAGGLGWVGLNQLDPRQSTITDKDRIIL